jgi:hypothetical protein
VHPLVGFGLLRVVRREDDDGDRASTGTRLWLPLGREPVCPGGVRIVAEPLEACMEGNVIDQWWNPGRVK